MVQPGPSLQPNPAFRAPTTAAPTRTTSNDDSGDWFENAMFGALDSVLYGLNATGLAKPAVNLALSVAASGNKPEWYVGTSEHAAMMLAAEYEERDTRKSFAERTAEYLAEAKVGTVAGMQLNGGTAFENAKFVKELEQAGNAKFTAGNSVEFLIDGPKAFAKRNEMIENATDSIHLLTWSIYDDATGIDLCKRLVKKSKEGVDVKVIVDRNIARQRDSSETLDYLEANGIEVILWEDPEHIQYGNHCKMMVVDGTKAIAGGINPGNYYSHGWNVDPSYDGPKWRDTDVYVSGPGGVDQEALFVSYWNSQIEKQNLDVAPMSMDRDALLARADRSGTSKVAVVEHKPDDESYDVLSTMMKAVSGATKTVDIENAYFLTLPGMDQLLYAALARGVKVRIFTNSNKSVDEPLVSEPIMKALPDLLAAGAEIYLKKGDTLHSKFMVVDETFVSLGSLNLHPRSLYYDTEMAVNIIDENAAKTLRAQFDRDIAAEEAVAAKSAKDLEIESTWYNRFIKKYFSRHL